jgi:hypothetical protein
LPCVVGRKKLSIIAAWGERDKLRGAYFLSYSNQVPR